MHLTDPHQLPFWKLALYAWQPVLIYVALHWWCLRGVRRNIHRLFDAIDGKLDRIDGTSEVRTGKLTKWMSNSAQISKN